MNSNSEIVSAAFFDRDGVINIDYGHVGNKDKLDYIEGALDAIKFLKDAGLKVFIVTNQAGIAKNIYTVEQFEECMEKIKRDLAVLGVKIDDIKYCPYHKDAVIDKYYHPNHPWRKPNPGMLIDLIKKWRIDKKNSFLIGNNESDVIAANRVNIKGYLYDGSLSMLDFVKSLPEVIHRHS